MRAFNSASEVCVAVWSMCDSLRDMFHKITALKDIIVTAVVESSVPNHIVETLPRNCVSFIYFGSAKFQLSAGEVREDVLLVERIADSDGRVQLDTVPHPREAGERFPVGEWILIERTS